MTDDNPSLKEYLSEKGRHTQQFKARVDPEVYERAKERSEYGELTRETRKTIYRLAFGDDRTEKERLRARRDEIDDELDDVDGKIRELQAKRDNLQSERKTVEKKLEQKEDIEDKVETRIEMHIDTLWSGNPVLPEHKSVKKTAELSGLTPDEIIGRIRDRVPFPDYAFTANTNGKKWNGVEARRFDRTEDVDQ